MNAFFHRVLVVALLTSAFCSRATHAQSIGIMPFERVTTAPKLGATFTDDIEIFNNGRVPVQVSASVQDWSLSPTGKKIYALAGSSPQSLGAILRLNPTDFSIPPRKSQRVRYSIAVPANMKSELRAMIFFTTRPLPVVGAGVSLNVSTRLGSSLFLLPPKSVTVAPQLKVSALNIVGDKPQIVASVENSGTSSTRLRGTIEARDAAGVLIASGVLPSTQLLSGGAREIVAQWKTSLPAGNYLFKIVLDSGRGKLIADERRVILVAPIEATVAPTPKVAPLKTAAPIVVAPMDVAPATS